MYIFRAETQDPDFDPDSDYTDESESDDDYVEGLEDSPPLSATKPLHKQSVFLVYESQLSQLMKYCINCGAFIDSSQTTEVKNTGSQLTLNFTCSKGT